MLNMDYKTLDKRNMFQNIYQFPDQIKQSMIIGENIQLDNDYSGIRNIIFAGMGGSAIGADILSVLTWSEIKIPITVIRNYSLPNWVDENSLVICFSYSGNTEETLSIFEDAFHRKAKVVGITSGGALIKRLQETESDIVKIPSGFPPRASLGYLSIPALYVLRSVGLISDAFVKNLHASIELLMNKRIEFSQISNGNLAFRIAKQIYSSIPAIYGEADGTAAIALRWRGQLAENGKILAFHHSLPEMNHNEIVGWQNNPELLEQVGIIWLLDKGTHPRTYKRQILTRIIIGNLAKYHLEIFSEGDSLIERMFYLIHLGDWVSFWVAILHGTDPTPVDKIDHLKLVLAQEK